MIHLLTLYILGIIFSEGKALLLGQSDYRSTWWWGAESSFTVE